MSLKYSGLLFVLLVTLEAINGSSLNNASSEKKHSQELPADHTVEDKSQTENGVTTESVKIIIPKTSEVVPKSKDTTTTTTTTTPIPTPTTSPAPSPSPTTSPAPSPAPTIPTPTPDKGSWVVRNDTSNMTCIIAGMAMQLNISYPSKNEEEVNAVLNVPKNANSSGTCGDPKQSLIIKWGPEHFLQINFSSNKTAKNFFISELHLHVNATVFKNAKDNSTWWNFKNTSTEFTTPLDMSYKCSKVQDINLESGDPKLKAVLSLKDTQFEAFMNKSKAEFGAVQDCDTLDTPDIVPIAVGCALAILVLVVLVAYLIGRKRSQNQGYLSM